MSIESVSCVLCICDPYSLVIVIWNRGKVTISTLSCGGLLSSKSRYIKEMHLYGVNVSGMHRKDQECGAAQLLRWSCDGHWPKVFPENNGKRSGYIPPNQLRIRIILLHVYMGLEKDTWKMHAMTSLTRQYNLSTNHLVIDFTQLQWL